MDGGSGLGPNFVSASVTSHNFIGVLFFSIFFSHVTPFFSRPPVIPEQGLPTYAGGARGPSCVISRSRPIAIAHRASQAASFKAFCERPENREMLMRHQRKEVQQMEKASARASALEFREKVLESDYEAQNNVAPFLENKVLRRIIKTFTNDPKGDFAKWARNPLVIQMLTRAKEVRRLRLFLFSLPQFARQCPAVVGKISH